MSEWWGSPDEHGDEYWRGPRHDCPGEVLPEHDEPDRAARREAWSIETGMEAE